MSSTVSESISITRPLWNRNAKRKESPGAQFFRVRKKGSSYSSFGSTFRMSETHVSSVNGISESRALIFRNCKPSKYNFIPEDLFSGEPQGLASFGTVHLITTALQAGSSSNPSKSAKL